MAVKPCEGGINKTVDHIRIERRSWRARLPGAAIEFVVLLAFWLVLSGRFKPKYIIFGIIAAALVTFMTNDIGDALFRSRSDTPARVLAQIWRFLLYIPWLLREIVKANIQVAMIVLNPRLPVDPALLQFKTGLRGRVAQVILANSITITPGTVTVDLQDGEFIVHTLVPASASGLVDASLENRIGEIFAQGKCVPSPGQWRYSLEEIE